MTIERYNLLGYAPKGYPVRHKRKVPFEPSILVPDEYPARARRIRTIDFELGRFILGETDLMRLVIDAFTSNVHWSTKLEGNPLSEVEVRRITTRTMTGAREKKGREKSPGPRQEIVNHISCLVAPSQFRLPWTHEHMLKLNRYLLKGTDEDRGTEGYKTEQNAVYSDTGAEVFVPTPPMHVRDEMQSLLDWVNGPARAFDPIVAATVFFHEFESIHPFAGGNGRTGRCLFHLLLQNSDLPNSNLCEIDKYLLEEGELYYQLLAYTDETGSYSALIDFVSGALLKSYEGAYQTFRENDTLELDEDSRRLFEMGKRQGTWFSVSDAGQWVKGVSHQTTRNKLNRLVGFGALEARGRTQSRRYRVMNPLSKAEGRAKVEQSVLELEGTEAARRLSTKKG